MSTYTSEPGTRLGGRYRLEDRVAAAAGWAAWKAIDETLARPVTVLTFAPGFPRLREAVTAARAASRLNDSRFAQVFDVEDDWDHAYIVMEWAAGESFDDMLAPGPLDAPRGARIVAEAAEAISVAHAAGLAHLCLAPDSLRWTPGGGVKITGLGINAALSGATAEDPALADTRRLGMLLYAALTGHWPGPDCPTLPPAPLANGLPCSPRQVRAGVPAALDEITRQVLVLQDRGGSYPVTTPAQLSTALMAAIPPVPIPPPQPRSRADNHRPGTRSQRDTQHRSPDQRQPAYPAVPDTEPPYWAPEGQHAPARPRQRAPGRQAGTPPRTRVLVITVTLLVVAVGIAAFALRSLSGGGHPVSSAVAHHPAAAAGATPIVLRPVSAQGFDENPTNANLAIDNNPATPWQTQYYLGSPNFGNLKQGSGLVLDMGRDVRLNSVTVTFGPIPGANVQIKIGSMPTSTAPQDPTVGQPIANAMTTVAQQTDVSGTVTFPVSSSATGRYVLIWFTSLPPMAGNPGRYQAEIYNIVVKGSS